MRLTGKNVIITGAGSGIGRAIAIGFANEGANIVAADINLFGADETKTRIIEAGGNAIACKVDVSQKADVEEMLHRSIDQYNLINVLVCSAGIQTNIPFLDLSEIEWDRLLSINLKGLFLCGQVVSRHMVENGGGSIINVTSQLAEVATMNKAHYHASKGGAKMLTQAMALELASYGIRVNALAPGPTNTPISPSGTPEGKAHREAVLKKIPLGRVAEPEEMVGAAVYLASDESSYVTGASLIVDGGFVII